jgi:ribonucleotide monophosphatase NagD (HAD superfamily)
VLAGELPPGAPVLVVGGTGVKAALLDAGLRPVDTAADQPVAVLQGFAPEVGWPLLAEAAVAVHNGARWTATNGDMTLPSPRGPLPGNGSLVAAVAAATGQQPRVIGKPERALVDAALAAHPGRRPLVIGDRLDTDIAGAHNAGLPSLLVLTGVSQAGDLLSAPASARPQYLGRDLRALRAEHPPTVAAAGSVTCGGAVATVANGVVRRSDVTASPDGLDGLRALVALAWADTGIASASGRRMYDKALESLDLD